MVILIFIVVSTKRQICFQFDLLYQVLQVFDVHSVLGGVAQIAINQDNFKLFGCDRVLHETIDEELTDTHSIGFWLLVDKGMLLQLFNSGSLL